MGGYARSSIVDRSGHWCVIGAGPAGLLAARSLRHAGIPYEQFEQNSDVGGIWDIDTDWTPMYETAHFISSKGVSHLPGYPMPADYPDYPNHRQVLRYLRAFARDYHLYPAITFRQRIARVEPEGGTWIVQTDQGPPRRYRGLFVCNGNTWDPNLPEYPGRFDGRAIHSVEYRSPELFRRKRVLVVGGGNSGCDIACDAARTADRAFISLRRGYHFVPKYIMGQPADEFAGGVELPRFLEKPIFELLLKLVVGDLRRYGLPAPDHGVMESHPIMNTEILHHLGHGDLEYRPDVAAFDGHRVRFTDGREETIDLVVFATGYKVTFPFMDRNLFVWIGKYPDLYLSGLHRERDNLCVLGLHQTDGGAYDFFTLIADMMCNFIRDQERDPAQAARFSEQKRTAYPDLSGGVSYVDSARHATYVKKSAYARYCNRVMRKYGWQRFSLADPPPAPVAQVPAEAQGRTWQRASPS